MNAPAGIPSWPALLSRSLAMAYCSLTSGRFEKAMSEGVMPMPVKVAGQERWVRAQLDEAIEQLTGGGKPDDWFARTPAARGRLE